MKNSDIKSRQKTATATQTIKEEPNEIGVVNVPASSSSKPNQSAVKAGTKRRHSMSTHSADNKKTKISSSSIPSATAKFTCEDCLSEWSGKISSKFRGDPNHKHAPEPKIRMFTDFESY